MDDPEKGLQVKQNLLATCKRCHPDASENFPDSWLGHYIPDPQRHPLVYYINLFYKIFIPTVLGGMAIFVASDIYYRLWGRKRRQQRGMRGQETSESKAMSNEVHGSESREAPKTDMDKGSEE